MKLSLTGSAALLYLAFLIAMIVGWVMNIVALIGSDFAKMTGLLVARILGVVVAPLGSVLGLFF